MPAGRINIIIPVAALISVGLLWLFPDRTLLLLPVLGVMFASTLFQASRRVQVVTILLILLVGVPVAGMENSFLLELFFQIGVYAALALGLNIVVGMAGLLDLGYAAFFAIGAYTWAIFGSPQANEFMSGGNFPLPGWPYFYLFIALAVISAALVGVLIGLPALRLRGDYLAIVTLGLGEVVRVLANNLDQPINFTNGPKGISPVERPPVGWFQDLAGWSGVTLSSNQAYALYFYFLVLAAIGLIVLVNRRLDRSRFGRAWVAIREDEIAARAMGIPLLRTKLLAFATGAAFSGVVGAIFAAKQVYIGPESFTLLQSITILAMVILGGMGSIQGALLGAAAVTLLNIEVLKSMSDGLNHLRQSGFILDLGFFQYDFATLSSQLEPAKYERMIFGLIMVLMMLFRPTGMIPEKRHRLEIQQRVRRKKRMQEPA